jgi:hypothetical protein
MADHFPLAGLVGEPVADLKLHRQVSDDLTKGYLTRFDGSIYLEI